MKAQDELVADVKPSQASVSKLTTEVARGNYLFACSSTRFKEPADRLEDKKFSQMLPNDSEDYKLVVEDYMEERRKRRKRKLNEINDTIGNENECDGNTEE